MDQTTKYLNILKVHKDSSMMPQTGCVVQLGHRLIGFKEFIVVGFEDKEATREGRVLTVCSADQMLTGIRQMLITIKECFESQGCVEEKNVLRELVIECLKRIS